MKVYLTIDDKNGIGFCGKRQSRDSVLIDYLLNEEPSLCILTKSQDLFEQKLEKEFETREKEDVWFLEQTQIKPFLSEIDTLVLCKWNRHYPSTLKLDVLPTEPEWYLHNTIAIKGTSHAEITLEEWRKK